MAAASQGASAHAHARCTTLLLRRCSQVARSTQMLATQQARPALQRARCSAFARVARRPPASLSAATSMLRQAAMAARLLALARAMEADPREGALSRIVGVAAVAGSSAAAGAAHDEHQSRRRPLAQTGFVRVHPEP